MADPGTPSLGADPVVDIVVDAGDGYGLTGRPVVGGEGQFGGQDGCGGLGGGGQRHRHPGGGPGGERHGVGRCAGGACSLGNADGGGREDQAGRLVVVGDGAGSDGVSQGEIATGVAEREGERLVGLVNQVAGDLHGDGLRGLSRGEAEGATGGGVVGARGGRVGRFTARRPVHRSGIVRGRRQRDGELQVRGSGVALGDAGVGNGERRGAIVIDDGDRYRIRAGYVAVTRDRMRNGHRLVFFVIVVESAYVHRFGLIPVALVE